MYEIVGCKRYVVFVNLDCCMICFDSSLGTGTEKYRRLIKLKTRHKHLKAIYHNLMLIWGQNMKRAALTIRELMLFIDWLRSAVRRCDVSNRPVITRLLLAFSLLTMRIGSDCLCRGSLFWIWLLIRRYTIKISVYYFFWLFYIQNWESLFIEFISYV